MLDKWKYEFERIKGKERMLPLCNHFKTFGDKKNYDELKSYCHIPNNEGCLVYSIGMAFQTCLVYD
jgi:hypothetical protein